MARRRETLRGPVRRSPLYVSPRPRRRLARVHCGSAAADLPPGQHRQVAQRSRTGRQRPRGLRAFGRPRRRGYDSTDDDLRFDPLVPHPENLRAVATSIRQHLIDERSDLRRLQLALVLRSASSELKASPAGADWASSAESVNAELRRLLRSEILRLEQSLQLLPEITEGLFQ